MNRDPNFFYYTPKLIVSHYIHATNCKGIISLLGHPIYFFFNFSSHPLPPVSPFVLSIG